MTAQIKGRVWKFDHDVDTDVLAPWETIACGWQERRGEILRSRPGFVDQVQPGDVIVAGRNWGCGSSREQAAENMKLLGLAAVVAESFGRIYFRNSIALALPAVACPGVHAAFEDGDQMDLDLTRSEVRNATRNRLLKAIPYTADMLAIIEKGGLMRLLEEKLHRRAGG